MDTHCINVELLVVQCESNYKIDMIDAISNSGLDNVSYQAEDVTRIRQHTGNVSGLIATAKSKTHIHNSYVQLVVAYVIVQKRYGLQLSGCSRAGMAYNYLGAVELQSAACLLEHQLEQRWADQSSCEAWDTKSGPKAACQYGHGQRLHAKCG